MSHDKRVSTNHHLSALRRRVAEYCEAAEPLSGENGADESYFGARRVCGGKAVVQMQESHATSHHSPKKSPPLLPGSGGESEGEFV